MISLKQKRKEKYIEMIESFIVGVVSGIVSSFIVTQIYRQIDKKQNRMDYICDLLQFVDEFENVLFCVGNADIEDEYIENAYRFVIDNTLPVKKKWIKLKKEEKECCDGFLNFYKETLNDIVPCHLNIQKFNKGETKLQKDIDMAKVKLSNIRHLEAMKFKSDLLDARRKYTE